MRSHDHRPGPYLNRFVIAERYSGRRSLQRSSEPHPVRLLNGDDLRVTKDGLKIYEHDNGGKRRRGAMSNSKQIYVAWIAALGLACGNLQAQTPTLPAISSVPPSVPYRWDNVVIRAGGFV